MPAPLVLAALAAAPALISAGSKIAGGLSHANREQRKLLKKDVEALKAGQLGLTATEKRQRISEASSAIRARSDASRAALQRNLAAGNVSASQATTAQAQLAGADQAAIGKAGGDIQRQSDEQARARKRDIIARMADQSARNTQFAASLGGDIASAASAGISAVPGAQGTSAANAIGGDELDPFIQQLLGT